MGGWGDIVNLYFKRNLAWECLETPLQHIYTNHSHIPKSTYTINTHLYCHFGTRESMSQV